MKLDGFKGWSDFSSAQILPPSGSWIDQPSLLTTKANKRQWTGLWLITVASCGSHKWKNAAWHPAGSKNIKISTSIILIFKLFKSQLWHAFLFFFFFFFSNFPHTFFFFFKDMSHKCCIVGSGYVLSTLISHRGFVCLSLVYASVSWWQHRQPIDPTSSIQSSALTECVCLKFTVNPLGEIALSMCCLTEKLGEFNTSIFAFTQISI